LISYHHSRSDATVAVGRVRFICSVLMARNA
jgi:hypothetical protein